MYVKICIFCFMLYLITFPSLVLCESRKKHSVSAFGQSFLKTQSLVSADRDISSISYNDTDYGTVGIGIEYSYEVISTEFYSSLDFNTLNLGFLYSDSKYVFKDGFDFRHGRIRTKSNNNDEISDNLSDDDKEETFPNAFQISNTMKFGYVFTRKLFFINELSHQAVYLQNTPNTKGFSFGLIPLVVYHYSTLQSDKSFLPVSEKEFYGESESWKGDSLHTIGLNLAPCLVLSDGKWFLSTLVEISSFKYITGLVYYDDTEAINEPKFELAVDCVDIIIGYTDNEFFSSFQIVGEGYKRYSLKDLNTVSLAEATIKARLKAGIRF